MSKFLKKFKKRNTANIRMELGRAHLIISLLSTAIIVLLSLGSTQAVTFDQPLSSICVALLAIVALISLYMTYTLFKSKK